MGFWRKETIHPKVLHSQCIKTVYNFIYRLSGNREVAEILAGRGLLAHPHDCCKEDVLLLKHAWKEFKQCNWYRDYKGEEPIQQSLLSLTPEQRCAVILRDILGYPYGEMALILNQTKSEVMHFLSTGRREITKSVKNQVLLA